MIGALVTSRNNYDFMDQVWLKNMNFKNASVLNIDEGSTKEEQLKGKNLCAKHGIEYLKRRKPGIQNNIALACEHFLSLGVEYLVWFQHDCWPITENFFGRLDKLASDGKLDQFGTFGFNALATDASRNYKADMKRLNKGRKVFGVLGRCPLQGRTWLAGMGNNNIWAVKNTNLYTRPFAIESASWFAIGLNIKKFEQYAKSDSGFMFQLGWDDVCFQFLNKNIYNVALSDIHIAHRPDLKPDFGLPRNSAKVTRTAKSNYFFESCDHMNHWKDKWGWTWPDRSSFGPVQKRYKGTLLHDFYHLDPEKGPLKEWEI